MAFANTTISSALLCIFAFTWIGALVQISAGAVQHVVGDSDGWTIPAIKNVNYTIWADDSTFHVGDTLVFKYDASLHNVEEVTKGDFDSCSAAKPKASYDDGNTVITLDRTGTWYFICGFPGHCTAEQRLSVEVSAAPEESSPAEAPAPSPEFSISPAFSPSPSINLAPSKAPSRAPTSAPSRAPFSAPRPTPGGQASAAAPGALVGGALLVPLWLLALML